ncbi:glucuronate isomerase [Bacillus sp. USDA818B3_A]|uniref:glucuronate isomerase n=1 Tax=Bacillus sp. USDA818B3_A TaxID=2698834 RepID=UPI00136828C6|nr:glucuronate isomerase [Bacillus sp. USDA818B3_A]
MSVFMGENFLLKNETAVRLYHDYAKQMPIIDYHCHLSPKEIYENKTFKNITEIWLDGDHYKWRLMRSNGVEEQFITGSASDYEKFMAWARTVPMTIGNPVYNWTHLELQRFFGIDDVLDEESAPQIWERVNALLNSEGFAARDFIKKSNVKVVCTTDDPIDSLEYHLKLQEEDDFDVQVLPSFRPDKGLEINRGTFQGWVEKLQTAAGIAIESYEDYLKALESRVRFFDSVGCKVSDHAIDQMMYADTTREEAAGIFNQALQGKTVSVEDEKKYKAHTYKFLGSLYSELGWAMQFHINALRNNNSRMFEAMGPDTGWDSINDEGIAKPLSRLLDSIERESGLPKTIIYSLNPNDNTTIASMIGNFQGGGIPGKIQFGTAWWFNDNKDGMLEQMRALSNMGLFSRFIGMLTDSRSFLSYTRHEYFRRIVCSMIAEWVENGEVPNKTEFLGKIVQGICYDNAKEYFGFDLKVGSHSY